MTSVLWDAGAVRVFLAVCTSASLMVLTHTQHLTCSTRQTVCSAEPGAHGKSPFLGLLAAVWCRQRIQPPQRSPGTARRF